MRFQAKIVLVANTSRCLSCNMIGYLNLPSMYACGIYSCFEKGCPTKPYATMPKGIMGSRGLRYLIEALGVSAT